MTRRTAGPALVVHGADDVRLEERPVPAARPGHVVVEPAYVGLCGTDLEIIGGDLDPAYVRLPLVLGHEWAGRVTAVGDGVTAFTPGDHVVGEGVAACGVCRECRRGATNLCTNYDELGFTIDGALAPAVALPEHFVHRLAPGTPLLAGALVEPAAVVLRGLREIAPVPGERVLVIGDGTVALLAAQLVRMWSPSSVTVAGLRPEQADLATAVRADAFTTTLDDAPGYDVVIEAAGSIGAVETALRKAVRGGRVLLLGISGHGKKAAVPVDDLVNNDLTIRGSFSYTASAWAETVRLLNSGEFDPAPLVTHRFPIQDFRHALEVLATGDGGPRGKVVFVVNEAAR